MKPPFFWMAAAVGLAALAWVFPAVHVRSLRQVRAAQAAAAFDPAAVAETFWDQQLLPAAAHAADAVLVLKAIAANPDTARKMFGHTVGLGSSYFYFLRGNGEVVSVTDDAINLNVAGPGHVVDLAVPLGPVFGDALRDGSGLLNASDYPNSQQFNDLSAALDHRAETGVLPDWQRLAKPGVRLAFAGCVEVDDEGQDLKPLKLVPILVKE